MASRDADGYIFYIGRTDDVFKVSDYKISHDPAGGHAGANMLITRAAHHTKDRTPQHGS